MLGLFSSISPAGFRVLDGTSSAVVAARPASSPQVVPEFDEGLAVLPDQLVTEQDVPAAAETEQRRNDYTQTLEMFVSAAQTTFSISV